MGACDELEFAQARANDAVGDTDGGARCATDYDAPQKSISCLRFLADNIRNGYDNGYYTDGWFVPGVEPYHGTGYDK